MSAHTPRIPPLHSVLAGCRSGVHQVRERLPGKLVSPGFLRLAHCSRDTAGTRELSLLRIASGAALPDFRAAECPVVALDRHDDVEQGHISWTPCEAKAPSGASHGSKNSGTDQCLQKLVEIVGRNVECRSQGGCRYRTFTGEPRQGQAAVQAPFDAFAHLHCFESGEFIWIYGIHI